MPAISFDGASFSYDGKKQALENVSLTIEKGSFTCVLGGNGSGKSTLAKLVNALLVPDTGSVEVLDHNTSSQENLFFIRSNAGMVFQNPDDQIVASMVEDDVAFGPENLGIPENELQQRVQEALKQVGLQGFAQHETHALSGGQKQRVAFAGVLAMHPQILLLDEAGAMLDPRGQKALFQLCRELNQTGLTIILITHSMDEAAQSDRVIILAEGSVAKDGAPREVLCDVRFLQDLNLDVPFAAKMTALLQERGVAMPLCITSEELVEALHSYGFASDELNIANAESCLTEPIDPSTISCNEESHEPTESESDNLHVGTRTTTHQTPLLSFVDVSFTYASKQTLRIATRALKKNGTDAGHTKPHWGNQPDELWALRNINLSVHAHDFLGLAGHTGSGKSTLLQLANGILRPTKGHVLINGNDTTNKRTARQAHQDIGLVFQYPERQLFAATVFDDVAFGPRNLGFSEEHVQESVTEALHLMQLDVNEIGQRNPFVLSGGQQRRVAIAGVLAMDPNLLILDEPAAGLDPQAHDHLLRLIAKLHSDQGKTVVMVSHDMDDLAYHCNRIAILNQGYLFAQGAPDQIFRQATQLERIGLALPRTLQLMRSLNIEDLLPLGDLKQHGIPSASDLADYLANSKRNANSPDPSTTSLSSGE